MTGNRKVNRYHPYKRPDADEVSIRRRFFAKYHQNVRLIFRLCVTTTMLNMQTMEYMTLSDVLFMKVIDFVSCAKLHIDRYCGLRILARFTYLEGQRRKRRFHPYKRPENLKNIKSQLVWTECIKASLVELGEMKQENNQEYKSSSVPEMKKITAEISQNSPDISEILPTKVEDITTHDKSKTDEIVQYALSSDEISVPVEISKKSPVVPEILPANKEDFTAHDKTMTDENVATLSSHDIIKPDYDITSVEDNCSSQPDFRNTLLLTENDSIQIQDQANASSIGLSSSVLGNNDNDSVIEIVPLSEPSVLVDNGTTSRQINGFDNNKSTREPVDEKNESSDTPKPTDSFTHLSTNDDSDSEIDSETEEALLRIGSDESDCELSLSETTICRLLEIDPPDKLDKKIESTKNNTSPKDIAETDRTTCNSTEVDELHDKTVTDDSIEKIASAKSNTSPKDVADTSETDRTTSNSTEVDELHDDTTTDDNVELEEFFTQIDEFLEEVGFNQCDVVSESEDKTVITEETLTLNDIHANNSSDQKEEVHPTMQNTICVERDVKSSKSVLVAKESLFTNNGLEHSKTRCDTVKTLSIDSDNSNNDVVPKTSIIPCDTKSSPANEKERIDIPMSSSNDEHKQALEEASNSGIDAEEPGTTNSGALEDKFENKEMPENACLRENHQQRQPLGETKSNTGLEFSTKDHTTPAVLENNDPEVIKQEKPRNIKPGPSYQALIMEVKKDLTIQNKPVEIKLELPKQAMLKDEKPKLPKKAQPKDVKPELPKNIKLNDIKLELAQLVKLNDMKPKIVKQAKPKGIKPELSKLVGVNDINQELFIQEKPIDVNPELPHQEKLKDVKPGLSNQSIPVVVKLMLPKQVKSNDVKLEATKQAKLSDEKLDLSKQTNPIDIKSEFTKQAKLNDAKSELPKYTRQKDVNLKTTDRAKPNLVKFEENKKPKFVPIPIKYGNDEKARRVEGKDKQMIQTTEEKSKTTVHRKVLPPKQKYTPAPLSNNETDKTGDSYNKARSVKTTVVDNSVKNQKLVTQKFTSEQRKFAEDSKSTVKAVATKPKYESNPIKFLEKRNQNVHQADAVPKPKYRPNPTKSALMQKASAEQSVVAQKKKFKPVPIVFGEGKKASAEATMPDSKRFKPKPIESLEENEANINKEVVASKPKFKSVPIIFGEGKEPRKDIEIKASTPSFQEIHAKNGQESKTRVLAEAKAPKRKFKPVPITLSDEGNGKLKFNPEQPIEAVTPKRKFRPTPITFGEEHRKVDMFSQEQCVEAVEPKRKFKPTPISFGNDGHRKFDTVSKEEHVTDMVETPKPKFKPKPILFENQGLRKIGKSSQEERVEYRKRRFASSLDDTGPRKLKLRY